MPRTSRSAIDEDELERKVKVVLVPCDKERARQATEAMVDLILSAFEERKERGLRAGPGAESTDENGVEQEDRTPKDTGGHQ